MGDAVEAKVWSAFMESAGADAELTVAESLRTSQHLFDFTDGTHGKWVGESLGMLLAWSPDDVFSFLAAWNDACDGQWSAQKSVMQWVEYFADFLEQCVESDEAWPITEEPDATG